MSEFMKFTRIFNILDKNSVSNYMMSEIFSTFHMLQDEKYKNNWWTKALNEKPDLWKPVLAIVIQQAIASGNWIPINNSSGKARFLGYEFVTYSKDKESLKELLHLWNDLDVNPLACSILSHCLNENTDVTNNAMAHYLQIFQSGQDTQKLVQEKYPGASLWMPAWFVIVSAKIAESDKKLVDSCEALFKYAYIYLILHQDRVSPALDANLLNADAIRTNCPPLNADMLTDRARGLWELWPVEADAEKSSSHTCPVDGGMARNPRFDIQKHVPVCIDFGTSSTVVALREKGESRLLRVGLKDWKTIPVAQDYENPTVLQLANAENFLKVWQEESWRPRVSVADMKFSHQARAEMRSAIREILASSVANIKTWAFHEKKKPLVTLRDQQDQLFSLTSDMDGDVENRIDPVEIYAFYLGLAVNNQYRHDGRIYHDYYLSFPVKFDRDVRRRIRSSFEKGLMRSLPSSLGMQEGWEQETPFCVHEGADEPVAYAAAWLAKCLELDEAFQAEFDKEDSAGQFCGVFDFGGGTTDFAFLQCRKSKDEEWKKHRWDTVIELLDSDGDQDLGGEKLLHSLACHIVKNNLQALLSADIPFLPPLEGALPAGSELIFHEGLISRLNTVRLTEALRPLWEEGKEAIDPEGTGTLSLNLIHEGGKEKSIALAFDADECLGLLKIRIRRGVDAFFTAAEQAVKRYSLAPQKVHILLAGNACRSFLVTQCFDEAISSLVERNNCLKKENFELVLPSANLTPEALSLKNGVALGLLELVAGEGMGLVRSGDQQIPGQAFQFAFGIFRRNRLLPLLTRHSLCDEWKKSDLQVTESLVETFGFVRGPEAIEGRAHRSDCHELSFRWNESDKGKNIFLRTVGPCEVEVALGSDKENIDEASIRKFDLSAC